MYLFSTFLSLFLMPISTEKTTNTAARVNHHIVTKTIRYMKCTCILFLACFFCLPCVSIAQKHHGAYGVTKGSVYISPGIGIGRIGKYSDNPPPVWKHYGADLKMPLITASLDLALTDYITVAPFVGYAITGEDYSSILYNYRSSYRCKHILAGSKNAFHFPMGRGRFTGYTGITLGVHLAKEKLDYKGQNANEQTTTNKGYRFFYNVFAGTKFHISHRAAVFAEVGYGITWGNVGVSYKLD
jgi:hypothetical protein